jgi:hypothetical protein
LAFAAEWSGYKVPLKKQTFSKKFKEIICCKQIQLVSKHVHSNDCLTEDPILSTNSIMGDAMFCKAIISRLLLKFAFWSILRTCVLCVHPEIWPLKTFATLDQQF